MTMRGARSTIAAAGAMALSPAIGQYYRSKGIGLGARPYFAGLPVFSHKVSGQIQIGNDVKLVSSSLLSPLGSSGPCVIRCMNHEASITIGHDCGFTGSVIVAGNRLTIGDRVMFGPGVVVLDGHAHPMLPIQRRYLPPPPPEVRDQITIGDDVFIGMRAFILPGVTIGAGSVIGTGSVVVRSIPAGVIAAGSPARVLRALDDVMDPTVEAAR
jgi:acetyltransferase-like isoleucine patch superfamily enzyme